MSSEQQKKVKGVADLVFLMDVTGSMGNVIDDLKRNVAMFIDSMTTADANNTQPIKDWRAKVAGYRDVDTAVEDKVDWFVDNPFIRDANALKSQLNALKAEGGGDEPESLLDALYKVATIGESELGVENPNQWRYHRDAARVVVVFTDASYKPTMSIPEARGGGFDDVKNVLTSNRIILSLFAPDMECHDKLGAIDKSEYEAIPYDSSNPDGAQVALREFTSDQANFKNTLTALAKSVSKSAETLSV
jgi:hypothetical protein